MRGSGKAVPLDYGGELVQALLKCCIQQAFETTFMVVGVAATNIQMVAGQGQQASTRRWAQRPALAAAAGDSNRECVLLCLQG